MNKYQCSDCGWIYDEAIGYPERGIAPGTKWEDVPDDFKCANCSNRKNTHKWKKLRE
ncbi:MAG: rubredoxin [Candidatus Paceibacterota bacterium]|jgi:rubredoxin-NAD+ reductase